MPDSSILPDTGMSPLGESFVAIHELFSAYIQGGFTERQAMQLVIGLMTTPPAVCDHCGQNPRKP